ncbi:hypothetical protein [Nitratireductor sp.]|uniref:hypothetical protein n=1 Tax=Nitratireductor sp. TaxID=1872084 RepID=UPI002613B889|nr:hypothetical protein [Nitratireductor sp.]MCV0378993.1 hypothetical protein [Nitratireductor sp.]
MQLHELISVTLAEGGVICAKVDITDIRGERYTANCVIRDGDECGLVPVVRQAVEDWISAGNTPAPFTPITPEELRASMRALSARQLRLGLIANGITLASVQAAIDGIADPTAREIAQVEWDYATTFERTHSLILQIGTALNLTPEEIDVMWSASISL